MSLPSRLIGSVLQVSRWDWLSACLACLALWFFVDLWFSTFSLVLSLGKQEDLQPYQVTEQIIAVAAHHDRDWTNVILILQAILFCRFLKRSDRKKAGQTRSERG